MAKEAAKSAMSGKSKSKTGGKKHKVHAMHIRPGAGGGYIAKHDVEPSDEEKAQMMQGGGAPQSPEYALADQQALHDHIDEHMPEQGGDAEAGDGAAGQSTGMM